jgi:alkylated DNA repair protein (DNA oxidative demethylase)
MTRQLTLGLEPDPDTSPVEHSEALAPGAVVLRGFALSQQTELIAAVSVVTREAAFRQMLTPGGLRMSVGLTNCGALGWVSDRAGYRYTTHDPDSDRPWPSMPAAFRALAEAAAERAGYRAFAPDACLVNRYLPGTRLTLHQDRNELDFSQPIVSVSLGLPAVFLFGGEARKDTTQRVLLRHGDVVVWGGPSRLHYHGVMPLKEGQHPLLGEMRVNLTLRRAG